VLSNVDIATDLEFDTESLTEKRKRVVLTDEQVTDLGIGHEAGETVPQLVEFFGCHRATVLNTLKKLGIKGRAQHRLMNDYQVAEAAIRFSEGESLVLLGQAYGVDPGTVRRELRKLGI